MEVDLNENPDNQLPAGWPWLKNFKPSVSFFSSRRGI